MEIYKFMRNQQDMINVIWREKMEAKDSQIILKLLLNIFKILIF